MKTIADFCKWWQKYQFKTFRNDSCFTYFSSAGLKTCDELKITVQSVTENWIRNKKHKNIKLLNKQHAQLSTIFNNLHKHHGSYCGKYKIYGDMAL